MLFTSVLIVLFLNGLTLAESVDDALRWGPYRPNLYFGVRPRTPAGPTFGLMWGSTSKDGKLDRRKLRHACEQSDKLASYGWTSYDARTGGVEIISDPGNAVNLTLEFVKIPDRSEEWSLRVKGVPFGNAKDWNTTLIFYVGAAEEDYYGNATDIKCSPSSDGSVSCRGDSYDTALPSPTTQSQQSSTVVKSLKIAKDRLWEAKSLVLNETLDIKAIANGDTGYGTLHFIQRSFDSSFSFDIHSTVSSSSAISSEILSEYIQDASKEFDQRFDAVYSPNQRLLDQDHTEFCRSLLANLMGGIGYFYGDDRVNASSAPPGSNALQDRKKKHELFTMVPSRAFFPRGFLWDEGFHLLIVMEWDLDLALEILGSWLALMDEDGWIGREQILGPEARSKVPAEFQVQYLDYANPPTLYLVVEHYLEMVTRSKKYKGVPSEHLEAGGARIAIGKLYLGLKKHYEWWRRTQNAENSYVNQGNHIYHSYHWRGGADTHILTSGLDDYPRANPQGPNDLHVDALSWVTLMAGVLVKIADYLGATKDLQIFSEHKETLERSLEFYHWSEVDQAYCDVTQVNGKNAYVCHKGYLTILPLLLGNINATSPHLNATLTLMRNETELWSPHGLRSLSRVDKLFGTDEDYWRGPIWININYLAIIKLLELAETPGPLRNTARQMYTDLRTNIINTVYNSWRQTGFAWEQYNPNTGAGQRTQGFTGWTALVVNILALPDFTQAAALVSDTKGGTTIAKGTSIKGADVIPIAAEADMAGLPVPVYLEKSRFGISEVGFWFGVVVVVVFVLSGLFAFKAWYLKRTGLSGRVGRPGYAGL